MSRGVISGLGRQIGVGKESDIFEVTNDDGEQLVLKLARLGRTSFRAVKQKRDYLEGRQGASFLYMSRLAATREYAYMVALHEHGFRVPRPVDQNRHCVLMSRVQAYPFTQVREVAHPAKVYADLMNTLVRLAEHGLIHGDFNEFNLMIDDDEVVTVIDFPQMVSSRHPHAREFFDRDVKCVRDYFRRKFNFVSEEFPRLAEDTERLIDLDDQLKCSGVSPEELEAFQAFLERNRGAGEDEDDSSDEDGDGADEKGDREEEEEDDAEGDAEDEDAEGDAEGDEEDEKDAEKEKKPRRKFKGAPSREAIRERVKRQYRRAGGFKKERNTVKSKQKRRVREEVQAWT